MATKLPSWARRELIPLAVLNPTDPSGPPDQAEAPTLSTPDWHYRFNDSQPQPASDRAVRVLAAARGERAVRELLGIVDALDVEIAGRLADLGRPGQARYAVPVLDDAIIRRGVYLGRLNRLAGVLGIQFGELPAPPSIPAEARLLAIHDGASLQMHLGGRVKAAREQLAAIRSRQSDAERWVGSDQHYQAKGLDLVVKELNELEIAEADAVKLVNQAEADQALATELVRARVSQAVQAAGGRDAVASAVVATMTLREPAEPVDPIPALQAELDKLAVQRAALYDRGIMSSSSLTAGAQRSDHIRQQIAAALTERGTSPAIRLSQVTAELAKLAEAGIDGGPAFDRLVQERQSLQLAIDSARSARAATRRREAGELVDLALTGDEAGRAAIEVFTTVQATAFPAGFAEALAEARADRAALASLAAR